MRKRYRIPATSALSFCMTTAGCTPAGGLSGLWTATAWQGVGMPIVQDSSNRETRTDGEMYVQPDGQALLWLSSGGQYRYRYSGEYYNYYDYTTEFNVSTIQAYEGRLVFLQRRRSFLIELMPRGGDRLSLNLDCRQHRSDIIDCDEEYTSRPNVFTFERER